MGDKFNDNEIEQILKFDPIDFSEKNFGDGLGLGLFFAMGKSRLIEKIMGENGDSYHSMAVEDYLKVVQIEGFEPIFVHHFASTSSGMMETMYIMYKKPEGILLVFDTYRGNMNGGNFYYNWVPKTADYYRYISSCSMVDLGDDCLVVVGSHDCREAIRYKIRRLKEHGEFLQNWVERPFLWLLCHGDEREGGRDLPYEQINEKRISAFPESIRKAISPVGGVV